MAPAGIFQRHPTVLFCDLVDSSRIAEKLDGEQFWDVVVNYQDACNQVVSRFDGYIYKSLGDGLIVLFGLPLAHEDDARRAVYTGLGIVEAVRRLNPMLNDKYGIELSVRVGIHTGEVVVGKMRGITEIAGSTPAQASRIQGKAAPNSTLISRDTADLVSGYFELESRGKVELRGMTKPVEVLEVLRATEAESRLDAQGATLTPMVGRQAELRQLQGLWEATLGGDGRTVLIRGEAGIGKSRLARYVRDLSARTGGSPLQGSCSPYYTSAAFHPLARMLSRRLGFTPETDDRQRLHSLELEMDEAGLERSMTIPYLAPVLSIELDPEGPYPSPRIDALKLRENTIEAFRSWWSGLAAGAARVVLIEDLHWAEPSTLELIDRTVVDPPPGLLLVLTARPEFPARESTPNVTNIELQPLPISDRYRMIRSIGAGGLAERVMKEIADRSDGVPLFVEELSRTFVDTPPGATPPMVPATLRDMLVARLESAGPDLKVAQAAAVIGSQVDIDLLKDVARMEEEQLRQDLDSLTTHGLLGTQGVGNERRYAFRHSLIRDAAYESQLAEAARVMHSDVANALIKRLGRPDPPDQGVIALHLDQAGRGEEAVGFYVGAAQTAQSAGAYAEALSKLDRALDLILGWPPGEARALSELTVRMLKAASLVATGGYGSEAAGAEFESALELAESLRERPESVGVQLAIMAYATVRGLRTKAGAIIDLLNRQLTVATPDELMLYGPEVTVSDALHRYGLGEYDAARRQFERAIDMFLARPPGFTSPLWTLPNSPLVAAYAQLVPVLWVQGERTAAAQAADRALELSGQLGFPAGPFSEAYGRAYLGYMCQLEGDWARAVAECRAVTSIGVEHGFAMWEGLGAIHALIAAAHLEPTTEAVAAIAAARQTLDQLGVSSFQPYFATAQAELTAVLGDLDSALALFDEAVRLSERTDERHYLAETYRKRAATRAALPQSDPGEVKADLLAAFELARDQHAFVFQTRAAIDMHRLLDPGSRPEFASETLARAETVLESSVDYPEAQQAVSLLTGGA
ncbi:MAG TPA: adenylate/guanylate cyclase domain-containing protein [Acidimicrobiia bacterium]|nr:adenylate/guanylate cyclase domain-containing protein [Acidimicrobiia bacterium]